MSDEIQPTQNEINKRQPGKRIPGILLRLFLAAITGTIIGAVIYYTAAGWIPYLDQRVFQPIDRNQAELKNLITIQQGQETQIALLQDQLLGYQATIESLEIDLIQEEEDNLSLFATVDANTRSMLQHTQSLATLDANLQSTNRNLSALATAQMRNYWIQNDLSLLKVIDLLTLANQYLLHADYGQAKNELHLVRDELILLQESSPGHYQSTILQILELVDDGIDDLPENYSLASEKVQLARQMAIQGFPDSASGTITPTPYLTPFSTPTPGS